MAGAPPGPRPNHTKRPETTHTHPVRDLLANITSALRRPDGQTLVEYGLLLALIALGVVASLAAFGHGVDGLWSTISAAIPVEFIS